MDPSTDKIHRVTFSQSLADLIVEQHHPEMEVRMMKVIRGAKLEIGEESRALYGIVSTSKDLLLRVPIRKELAEIYACCDSRHIEEVFLVR